MKGQWAKFVVLSVLLLGIGCRQSVVSTPNTPQETSTTLPELDIEQQRPATETASVHPAATPSRSASSTFPDQLPTQTVLPAELIQATPTSIPTPEATPTPIIAPPDGNLLILAGPGLIRLSVATGETEVLVPRTEEWLLWRFDVSPDGQQVAYWIHTAETSELWLSEIATWSPELVLTVSNLEHNAANLWWLSNDYLLLEPGNISSINLFLPLHAYIIDINQQQVEIEDNGFAFGCLLAPSPQTEQIATWCPAKGEWIDWVSYYTAPASYYAVIEEAGFLWTTTESPTGILAELKISEDGWAWANDRSLVAFPVHDATANRDVLYFTAQDEATLVPLVDPAVEILYFNEYRPWSPNKEYLAYLGDGGECANSTCYRIIDVANEEIVWTSLSIPDAKHLRSLVWSLDSQYIAILTDEGLFIVHLQIGSVMKQYTVPLGHVLLSWQP
jgi:hypothetical protein